MTIILTILVFLLSFVAWAGQLLAWFAPEVAVKLGLTESETDVHPVIHTDVRAECIVDAFTLWMLPAAAILFLIGSSYWVLLGPIGGGMYFYFAARGIVQRFKMTQCKIEIGSVTNVKAAYVFLTLWGLTGVGSCIYACVQILHGGIA
ncbi:MAG: hypothetical protein GY762_10830 [Proteobacteria bacterium]|nr:hypothetical protein [Pseudomonadota bacterium]